MFDYILDRIPEAGADDELRGLTLGSCSSNLEAVLSMVRHGLPQAPRTGCHIVQGSGGGLAPEHFPS